ncbi:MAG: hypothetical protein IPJ21_04635 [Sterolibacteriaceae bacterium]|jgi:hypothetical protein|uniref:Uncharacterized protein n=1 Tax=Candidatus Methylophosphatis roskildensis TaxID=2899263 RepID=A0A9D7HL69_9PROT|nr:hypothetical protein [Candidatus Methylophosphatis roskildensis]MBK7235141.1 hypothetical protein [Sterolibacteriaceae bacterium]MBK7662831.1 hypothetical protein [Sterolibacteriaceae bacterium]MBK9086942.1 hypothetical protein [Sterolibacteriaceae bacterium]
MARISSAAAALLVFSSILFAAEPDAVVIGGARPAERPADAPVMRASDHDRSEARQMRGVVAPYPKSLRFVANHGGWFTPFTEPGMTGRYDLRGYHNRRHPEPDVVRADGG